MSINPWSAPRIAALLLVAAGAAWGTGQYLDMHSFQTRNADVIAFFDSLTPGMPVSQAESRAHAISGLAVALVNGNLVVRIPGQNLCLVQIVDDCRHSDISSACRIPM